MTVDEWRRGPGKEGETPFQHKIIAWARVNGWRLAHFRPAQTTKGWRTPLTGDKGFFDLVLTRERETIVAELKAEGKEPDADQWIWLVLVASTPGTEVYVWRPEHWAFIEQRLRRRPQDPRGERRLPPYHVDAQGRVHVEGET